MSELAKYLHGLPTSSTFNNRHPDHDEPDEGWIEDIDKSWCVNKIRLGYAYRWSYQVSYKRSITIFLLYLTTSQFLLKSPLTKPNLTSSARKSRIKVPVFAHQGSIEPNDFMN